MKDTKRDFFLLFFLFMVFLLLYSLLITGWTLNKVENLHAKLIHSKIYEKEKSYLRNTVQNMISDIHRYRLHYIRVAEKEMERMLYFLCDHYEKSPQNFAFETVYLLKNHFIDNRNLVYFENTRTGETLYANTASKENLENQVNWGIYRFFYSTNNEWVQTNTKQQAKDIIHKQKFDNDSYIWVNEVLNWEGGDNYAIRAVHPNLVETEGSFLTTNATDIRGNFPYLEELEGVREHGELFSRYYFKRKNSNAIDEKLTYAALYKDYNWIVAMGSHINDIEDYILEIHSASKGLNRKLFAFVGITMGGVFIIGVFLVFFLGNRFIVSTKIKIKHDTQVNPLIGIYNKQTAEKYLQQLYKRFKIYKETPLILKINIDDLKKINDYYGTNIGDLVLCSITNAIQSTMRTNDELFHWENSEFLLTYNDIHTSDAYMLGHRLNREVSETTIGIMQDEQNIDINVTVSIGIAWFLLKDNNCNEVIKRTDQALNEAKRAGKNTTRVFLV